MEYDHLLKIVIVGDCGVGKSNLIARYVRNFFNPDPAPTVGVDFAVKQVNVSNKKIKVQLWDTAGQERFRGVIGAYFRGAHGVLVVYDITKEETFQNIKCWSEEARKHGSGPISTMAAGNKTDLEHQRAIPIERSRSFAEQNQMTVIECSAKDTSNVELLFETLVQEIVNKLDQVNDRENNNITIVEDDGKERPDCGKPLFKFICC